MSSKVELQAILDDVQEMLDVNPENKEKVALRVSSHKREARTIVNAQVTLNGRVVARDTFVLGETEDAGIAEGVVCRRMHINLLSCGIFSAFNQLEQTKKQ